MTEGFATDRRTVLKLAAFAAASASAMGSARGASAASPRVLPDGSLPADIRLGDLKDLDGYFPWHPSSSIVEWRKRADYVRRQLLVATGLWPMPTKHPLNAVVHGRVDRDEYTVDRVILQTGHGLYCTGSLYRPKAPPKGKLPAVLCPHGHWPNGRFHEHSEADFKKELESGFNVLNRGILVLVLRWVMSWRRVRTGKAI